MKSCVCAMLVIATSSAYAGIDPTVTVPRLVRSRIDVPPRISGELVDDFGEVMVYPEIDDPMYAPLMGISNESFLPNIQLLAMNSITLLETNQKFIESYMVGVNHEFARELLWREYPTDQRGSYMRQFWDPSGFLPEPGATPAAVRERLFDIPELHRWSRESTLGDHDNREINGDKEDELVLTVRGELLKKYPTAVIYAHRAEWQLTRGAIDKSKPRVLKDLVAGSPTRDTVKTPLYEAKVAPDIYFFGFDLTADVARGGSIADGEEDPGWFFVIKERPGEPRFGLDLPQDTPHGPLNTWNQLSWTDAVEHYDTAKRLEVPTGDLTVSSVGLDAENTAQHNDDVEYHWRSATHAAEIAYVLFQLPALMAVHAADMLRKGE